MRITDSQFEYLCRLSKLEFTFSEAALIRSELDAFIDYINVIRGFCPTEFKLPRESVVSTSVSLTYRKPSLVSDAFSSNALIGPDMNISSSAASIAVKDNIMVRGSRTTAGSAMLSNHIAAYDADVITRLRGAGFDTFIKTNMDEFAMGHDSSTGFAGAVKNPFDSERIPGGSSGGSAVAVATNLTRYALGSDTGGSIRQPAAYLGLTALKPTYGNVSRYGLIAYASSFDQIGPIAGNVEDCRYIYDIIAEGSSAEASEDSCAGHRILVPDNLLELCDDSESILKVASLLGEGRISHFDMPYLNELISCYYVIACAECSSNLSRYDSDRYMDRSGGFGFEVKKRILIGNYVLSQGFYDEYYRSAQCLRRELTTTISRLVSDEALIVMPVTKSVAPLRGESADNLSKYKDDIFTIVANLTGLPAITVPCANSSNGLPVGVQIMGKPHSEDELFEAAGVIEAAVGGLV